jgi:putative transposase
MVFLHVGTRRVFLSPATTHPDEVWVRQQAAAFVEHATAERLEATILFHDRDSKFTAAFDADLKAAKMEVRLAPPRSPNTCAFVERWIGSIRRECLNHFILLGERHLNSLTRRWCDYYHVARPHQGRDKGNALLIAPKVAAPMVGGVCCEMQLGGLLKHYYRRAA